MPEKLSKPVFLKELIGYQEGSVVSRTLTDKKSGIVTLFAFASGQGLSEHKTPYEALVQILEGKMKITVSGNEMEVKEGEILLMPADEPHALQAQNESKMLLTMLRG